MTFPSRVRSFFVAVVRETNSLLINKTSSSCHRVTCPKYRFVPSQQQTLSLLDFVLIRQLMSRLMILSFVTVFAVISAVAAVSQDSPDTTTSESCQQRFPFDRRDCTRVGGTCCPGTYGATECGFVRKSGLPKGRELKNPVCCLPIGSPCAKNKRYDQCCQPLGCQEKDGKTKCLPVQEGEEGPAAVTAKPAEEVRVEDDEEEEEAEETRE